MSKTRYWITILLILIILVVIIIYPTNDEDQLETTDVSSVPIYKSDYSNTMIYNLDGSLVYNFVIQHIEHFSNKKGIVSWFTQPEITIFDIDNKMPTWSIKSDMAKLTNDHMLYLCGHVEINALTINSQLSKIITDNAQINLITQDVKSQDPVTLYGTTFNSRGLKMYGNLRSKSNKLIEKVRTFYAIQNK